MTTKNCSNLNIQSGETHKWKRIVDKFNEPVAVARNRLLSRSARSERPAYEKIIIRRIISTFRP